MFMILGSRHNLNQINGDSSLIQIINVTIGDIGDINVFINNVPIIRVKECKHLKMIIDVKF